ncbi:MAG: uncharacterized protein QOE31_613 [Solirubrobacteraceae bacterium]|nr:uncharacterized protein [Solirubrobacteraceae bacterium]
MTTRASAVAGLPYLGSGLGYREQLKDAIFAARDKIDFLEIVSEQFLEHPRGLDELRRICDVYPVIPHGLGLSIGSASGVRHDYLSRIKRISDVTRSPYYSEHLCMTRAPGLEIGHLAPLALTEDVLRRAIDNVRVVQEALEKPLVLENVTYLFSIPGAEMTQPEFFARLVDATGCGVLLDVTNVFINATNHGFEALEFLASLPLESVVQVHLAGGHWSRDALVDSHSALVQEQSWQLFDALVARTAVRASIIEHDAGFPDDVGPLIDQVARARSIMRG